MKKFLREFKDFIMQGNVMDFAVGSIIALAFKDIVTSLTNDIISPILGLFGGVDFSQYRLVIGVKEVIDPVTGAVSLVENSINYGSFITGVINFIIMGLIIFCMVKLVAKISEISRKLTAKKAEEEDAPAEEKPETSEDILRDIRTLLSEQQNKKN